jgi:hypothetical protein
MNYFLYQRFTNATNHIVAHSTTNSNGYLIIGLFVWLVADGWCWFVLREKYCCLVAGGWFVVREKVLLTGG